METLRFFLQRSRRIVLLSVFAGAISGASNAVLLVIINSLLKRPGQVNHLLVWSFAAFCLLFPFTRFLSEILLNKLGQDAVYDLRLQLGRQMLSAPVAHLEELGPHRLLAVLTDDVSAITVAISVLPMLCINLAIVIGCLLFMASLSWLIFVMILVAIVIGILGYQLPVSKAQAIFMRARKDGDSLQKHLRALTHGTKELKMNGRRRSAFFTDMLQAAAGSFRRHNLLAMGIYSAASSWGQALVFVVVGLVLIVLPSVQHLDGRTITGYTLVLLYFSTPLSVVMGVLPTLGRASVAVKKVRELGFNLACHATEPVFDAQSHGGRWCELQLSSVLHEYRREDGRDVFVLGPIDLQFHPGEIVFITGGNGSGKTTLLKLLIGLYIPAQGEIRLDGFAIDNERREAYRQNFSVVFSDFFLFEHMLGIDEGRVASHARQYLDLLGLSHKVRIESGKLSTLDLSQGQKRRLALLAAYLEDRPIYVFDEWAADQDPHFRAVFYLELLPALKARNKTIFVISHDDRYYQLADRIIKLEEGQVVADTRITPADMFHT